MCHDTTALSDASAAQMMGRVLKPPQADSVIVGEECVKIGCTWMRSTAPDLQQVTHPSKWCCKQGARAPKGIAKHAQIWEIERSSLIGTAIYLCPHFDAMWRSSCILFQACLPESSKILIFSHEPSTPFTSSTNETSLFSYCSPAFTLDHYQHCIQVL
ncbi:uncharacterized protein [Physcomitrium patens]|uniref:Uncharacterized protein n=1 Tax=Physcomitrium patens TaxID=3218 RepID=A0A2K1L2G5_PHYPA|nr:hypothetical protein PHYPA_003012 [Physcomitrium patens]